MKTKRPRMATKSRKLKGKNLERLKLATMKVDSLWNSYMDILIDDHVCGFYNQALLNLIGSRLIGIGIELDSISPDNASICEVSN